MMANDETYDDLRRSLIHNLESNMGLARERRLAESIVSAIESVVDHKLKKKAEE